MVKLLEKAIKKRGVTSHYPLALTTRGGGEWGEGCETKVLWGDSSAWPEASHSGGGGVVGAGP